MRSFSGVPMCTLYALGEVGASEDRGIWKSTSNSPTVSMRSGCPRVVGHRSRLASRALAPLPPPLGSPPHCTSPHSPPPLHFPPPLSPSSALSPVPKTPSLVPNSSSSLPVPSRPGKALHRAASAWPSLPPPLSCCPGAPSPHFLAWKCPSGKPLRISGAERRGEMKGLRGRVEGLGGVVRLGGVKGLFGGVPTLGVVLNDELHGGVEVLRAEEGAVAQHKLHHQGVVVA